MNFVTFTLEFPLFMLDILALVDIFGVQSIYTAIIVNQILKIVPARYSIEVYCTELIYEELFLSGCQQLL